MLSLSEFASDTKMRSLSNNVLQTNCASSQLTSFEGDQSTECTMASSLSTAPVQVSDDFVQSLKSARASEFCQGNCELAVRIGFMCPLILYQL